MAWFQFNRFFKQLFALLVGFGLLLSNQLSWAGHSTTVGNYQINHIAYNSTNLSPEIAKSFGITRANNAAVINISVQDLNNEGKGVKVSSIKGQVKNMFQQVKFLDFNEVESGGAIYYLDQYRFGNEDALTFSAEIVLPGSERPVNIKWQQTLYKD